MFQFSCRFACYHVIVSQTAYQKLRVHAVHFSQLLSVPFLVALETQIFVYNLRNWWSTDTPASSEISLTVRWLWHLSSRLSNSDSTVSTLSSVRALRLPLPGRLSTVPNFTSSLLVLFFVQPLVRNSVINCYNLYILADFWLKFCLLYWAASKLPRLLDTVSKFALFSVSDLKDEKLIKSKPTWKLKHANSILETFEYFCQIPSKSILIISSYTVSKLGRFFETQCSSEPCYCLFVVSAVGLGVC